MISRSIVIHICTIDTPMFAVPDKKKTFWPIALTAIPLAAAAKLPAPIRNGKVDEAVPAPDQACRGAGARVGEFMPGQHIR
jgi:hypothetical protein